MNPSTSTRFYGYPFLKPNLVSEIESLYGKKQTLVSILYKENISS